MSGIQVALTGVGKTFQNNARVALQGLSLKIAPGEFLSVLGPSGCGKSTLLRLVAGLDSPTHGAIELTPKPRPNRVAAVFQDANLLPWRNVIENVALPLELRGMPRTERTQRALEAIRTLDLTDSIHQFPLQLSGGMKMRASLARALVTDPELLLLDEPFAALDEVVRHRLGDHLRSLWKKTQTTVIFVTHSISEAVFLSQRVVVLSRRPGRIIHEKKISLRDDRIHSVRSEVDFAKEVESLYSVFEREGIIDS